MTMKDILARIFQRGPKLRIDSMESLEQAALSYGLLPFFPNKIKGLSVEEMCAPGLLFGGNHDEGCWEWKGPVVRRKTTAYGKFFRKKAGFVSLDLFPDFLNYRRAIYPVKPESTEELLLDIIRENDGLSSTELRQYVFGSHKKKREWYDIPDSETLVPDIGKRKSLETYLQKLQMGCWIVISDFVYKRNKKGERYGWGVATYTTPELNFGSRLILPQVKSPEESLDNVISKMKKNCPQLSVNSLLYLLG